MDRPLMQEKIIHFSKKANAVIYSAYNHKFVIALMEFAACKLLLIMLLASVRAYGFVSFFAS